MQAMIDHVAAFIVGTSIVLILAMLMFRGQDLSISAVQVDAAKGGMRLLADMVDQDFTNMGSGLLFPNRNLATAAITVSGTDGTYQVLEFRGLESPTSTAPQLIRYRWRAEGSVTLPNGTTIPALRVERLVDGAVSGASFDNVTTFGVTLLKEDRTAPGVGERHLVRYVEVNIAMVSPLGPDEVLEQTYWRRQFRPVNLNSDGTTLVRVVL